MVTSSGDADRIGSEPVFASRETFTDCAGKPRPFDLAIHDLPGHGFSGQALEVTSERHGGYVFRSFAEGSLPLALARLLERRMLGEAFARLSKGAAAGIDGVRHAVPELVMACSIQLPPWMRNTPVAAKLEVSMFGVIPTVTAKLFVSLGADGSSAGPADT